MIRRTFQHGFTLLEVLTALVIFSVAVVGLLVNLRQTIGVQTRLLATARAAELANNVMEELKLSRKSELGSQQGQFKDDDAAYSWSSKTEKTDTLNLRQVTVTVNWQDGAREQNYQICTLALLTE